MWIEGRVFKSEGSRWWEAEVPALAVYSQGTSRKDAFAMLKDAVESLAVDQTPGLIVDVSPGGGETVFIGSRDTKALFCFLLRRQRQISGRSIKSVAAALGSRYVNAYAAYESGKREPTLTKAAALLAAVNPAGTEGTVHFVEPKQYARKRRASADVR